MTKLLIILEHTFKIFVKLGESKVNATYSSQKNVSAYCKGMLNVMFQHLKTV